MLLAAAGCERRPLVDMVNTHYVRVYIDEELKNVTTGFYNDEFSRPYYESPDVLRLILADPDTGQAKAERFLRNVGYDEKGTYYDGYIIADPGTYTLLAYNFDTESTIIRNASNHKEAKASTSQIASHLMTRIPSRANQSKSDKPERIVYDPDHLFAANCGEVHVPYVEEIDTLKTVDGEHFMAHSIVKSYFMQIRVKGLQYASSSVGLLTGMSGSSWLNEKGMDRNDPVTVYFELNPGETSAAGVSMMSRDGTATIYTTFSTFGKIPDEENKLEITFDFLTIYGEPYSETLDITDVFSTPEAKEHQWLLIDHTIDIPEPPEQSGTGGFTPEVSEWEDINTDLEI